MDEANRQLPLSYYNYKSYFSKEIRDALGDWFQRSFESFFYYNSENQEHVPQIETLISNMANQLEFTANNPNVFLSEDIRFSISVSAADIRSQLPEIAPGLYNHIRNCLQLEYDFANPHAEPDNFTSVIFERLRKCHADLTNFRNNVAQGGSLTTAQLQQETTIYRDLCQLYVEFKNEFYTNFAKMGFQLTARTTFRLSKWKEEKQKLAQGKSSSATMKLEELSTYYKYYANQLWSFWELIKEVEGLFNKLPGDVKAFINSHVNLAHLKSKVEEKLKSFVCESFVMTVQPSQLVVKDTKPRGVKEGVKEKDSEPTVTLLVGEQIRCASDFEVKGFILDEFHADLATNMTTTELDEKKCVNMENNSVKLSDTTQYSFNFKKALLHGKIARLKKKGTKYEKTFHYDENNWFYFRAHLRVDTIEFKLEEFSHPVKLTTNSSQNPKCMSTMLFDIAAGRFGVESVLSRKDAKVPWIDFERTLQFYFKEITGRALDSDELSEIKRKFLRPDYFAEITNFPMTAFTLAQLRENIPETKFSFGDWIYSAAKLISTCLGEQSRNLDKRPGLWKDKVFPIFLTQQKATRNLNLNLDGSFVTRISSASPDALTIDFVSQGRIFSHRCTIEDGPLINKIRDVPVWKFICLENAEIISRDYLINKYALPKDPTETLKPPYVKSVLEILEILNLPVPQQFTNSIAEL